MWKYSEGSAVLVEDLSNLKIKNFRFKNRYQSNIVDIHTKEELS